jgi:hypothetical protein
VLEALVDDVRRVVEHRWHHRERPPFLQERDRIGLIELRLEADSEAGQCALEAFDRPLGALPAHERNLRFRHDPGTEAIQRSNEDLDALSLFEPAEECDPAHRPARRRLGDLAAVGRGPGEVRGDERGGEEPTTLVHPVEEVPARTDHGVGELKAGALERLDLERRE